MEDCGRVIGFKMSTSNNSYFFLNVDQNAFASLMVKQNALLWTKWGTVTDTIFFMLLKVSIEC